jgi:ubiquinone/menaquinone biosynthesis C-methylase UbiE
MNFNNNINSFTSIFRRIELSNKSSDPWIRWHDHLTNWADDASGLIIEKLKDKVPQKLLDVATGTGSAVFFMSKNWPDCEFTGCDISPDNIEIASLLSLEYGLQNITFETCQAENMPFGNNSFDALTCSFSIMYFKDVEKALAEFFRITKPKGRIIITSWSGKNALLDLMKTVFNISENTIYPEDRNPLKFSEKESFDKLLEPYDAKKIDVDSAIINLRWQGNEMQLWDFFKHSNPSVLAILASLSLEEQNKKINSILESLVKFKHEKQLLFPAEIVIYIFYKN